jgi:hypothetical protein
MTIYSGDEIPPAPPPAYSHDLHLFAGGYPYTYYTDADDTTIENWISSLTPDIRFYRSSNDTRTNKYPHE